MYEVVLQLSDDVAAELGEPASCSGVTQDLLDLARECNIELVAQHPGVEDAELASYFSALVADADSAERVRKRFSTFQGVMAAYVKPPGEPP